MNVLSLFDGMSCGQLALERIGVNVDNYYAAEIDKYAMQITKKNYPDTIHLGDVTKLSGYDLPTIDLLMGGSPCQGFSFAGKQLNFDDPRSALFFEFVRLLKEINPKYFMLENVRMKQEFQDVISEHLGVKPIMINSALMSAQNRVRLYWTNIPNVIQPNDNGIVLKDILESDATEPMLSNIYGGFKEKKPRVHTGKSVTIRAASGGGHIPSVTLKKKDDVRAGQPQAYPRNYKQLGLERVERMEFRTDNKSNTVISNSSKNQIIVPSNCKKVLYDEVTYRKLTPLECERLQTVPENYTDGVSNSQRYKMIGNGWTVDVIAHILKGAF